MKTRPSVGLLSRRWMLIAIVLIAGLGIVGWQMSLSPRSHAAKQQGGGGLFGSGPMAIPVRIESPQSGTSGDAQEFLAQAISRQGVDIRPDVMGRVVSIPVGAGQYVQAGQTLMVIDPRQQAARTASVAASTQTARAGVRQAQANLKAIQSQLSAVDADLTYQTRQLQRLQQLVPTQVASQAELDQVQSAYDQALSRRNTLLANLRVQEATIAQAQEQVAQSQALTRAEQVNLSYYTIRAPFSGMVGDIPVKIGDYVVQNTVLASVSNNQSLELYIPVPADYGHKLRVNLPVTVLASDNTVLGRARVFFISPRVDETSQTILVKARFANGQALLRDQQRVRVRIAWAEQPTVQVPAMAIVPMGDKRFVMVAVSDDKSSGKGPKSFATQMVPVTLGEYVGDNIEVLSGLTGDERIVTTGMQKVAMMGPKTRVLDEAMLSKRPTD